ncbi:hypothetical protein AB0G85_35480, partial [Streptomyces sioyaensis]|uniref:hypothetical protein n=1 Tax=Streptomyces sioyaensis TaxID=67364 RepID=UPI0033FDC73C
HSRSARRRSRSSASSARSVATLLGGRDAIFRTLLDPVRPVLLLVGAPMCPLCALFRLDGPATALDGLPHGGVALALASFASSMALRYPAVNSSFSRSARVCEHRVLGPQLNDPGDEL